MIEYVGLFNTHAYLLKLYFLPSIVYWRAGSTRVVIIGFLCFAWRIQI